MIARRDAPHLNPAQVDHITHELKALADIEAACKVEHGRSINAERYEWLRQRHWYDSTMCVVLYPKQAVKLAQTCPSHEMLDAMIDDARKK